MLEEQRDLGLGDEERVLRPCHRRALEFEQLASLAAVDPGQRPVAAVRVLGPLGRIDVDQIDQRTQSRSGRDVLRHGRGKHHRRVGALLADRPLDPGGKRGAAVVRQRQRLAVQEPREAAQPRGTRRDPLDVQVRAQGPQRVDVRLILRIVDERAQEDPVPCRQVLEQMVRTNLVPLVGGVRQAVDEVEDVRHY